MIPTRNNLTWVYQNPRSPLAPLVQKCQQMYFQCLHQKLYHITISDYEDFVSIVCNAKQAFHLTPDGISQFKEWLTNLRRSKACKKDLWTQITAALQSNPKWCTCCLGLLEFLDQWDFGYLTSLTPTTYWLTAHTIH